MKPIFYAYMITVLVVTSCSSPKRTFEHGNYYEAVILSVNRLRRNSDHKKSVETLRQAYPMAVAFFEDRANTSLASNQVFKWSAVVESYTSINTMYDEIKRCPGALAVIPNPVNYFSKLQEAKQHAAEEHYAAGILALQDGTRAGAKKAYAFFKTANSFVPGYKEVNSYLAAALEAATVKIVVEPIPVHSKSVGVSAEFFNDKISEFVHGTAINEFVKFYSRDEAKTLKLKPDHIIELEFDDFTVGQVTRYEKELHLTKDSVVMATYVTPSTASSENSNTPAIGSNLVTTNLPVVANTQSSVTATQQASTSAGADESAARTLAEKEAAARALAEKQRAEREAAQKALAAQQLAEKQKAEKEAAERALQEKVRAEKEAAAKALAAQQLAEKQRAEKEAAEKALAEKEKAEKEAAAKALAAQQLAEQEKANQEAAAKARAAQELAAKQLAEKEAAQKALAEKQRAEQEAAAKALAAQQLAEKQQAEKEAAEKALAEKQRAEKAAAEQAAAEKARAEKEKAEREKAEKEKLEKDKAEKAKGAGKYVDDSIKKEDTTNVTDPVTICHIPPGNKMNHRTLVISRSALKAHLAHGDTEGSCEPNQKAKSAHDTKGPQEKKGSNDNKKDNKKDNNPGKKGSGKLDKAEGDHALLYDGTPVFIASLDTDGGDYLRYLEASTLPEGDTNKVYGTVKATLYQYRKSTTSKGVVSFRIIDAKTGALLTAEKMPGEFVWVSEWATFNGDERALSPEQLRLTRLKEQPAPAPQDLFIEFTKPIYDQITAKIRDFYKNY